MKWDQLPIFVLYYIHGTRESQKGVDWVQYHFRNRTKGAIGAVTSTLPEQQLILRLLKMNEKRLPSTYRPPKGPREQDFRLSFLIPVGPPDQKDLVKLNKVDGCTVCGEKAEKRCANCACE